VPVLRGQETDSADKNVTAGRKRTAGKFESGSSTQTSRFIPFAKTAVCKLFIPYQ
jgi:hypothetical protein